MSGVTSATKTLVLTPEQVAVVAESLCWFEDILINDHYAVAAEELLPVIAQVREMLGLPQDQLQEDIDQAVADALVAASRRQDAFVGWGELS